MTRMANLRGFALTLIFALLTTSCIGGPIPTEETWAWETVSTKGEPTARHEASLVTFKGKLYLLGGRRLNPVDVYDPVTKRWEEKSTPPIELHHFQAVVVGDAIYIIGAMTGGWPGETPVDRVIAYYPERDVFEYLHEIPESRRRGGAGAAVYDGEIYLTGGIINGHMDGTVPWLDVYDPATGAWRILPDAPHARDHFQAVVVDDLLYVVGGRRTRYSTGDSFELTTKYSDVFDLAIGRWLPVTDAGAIPTMRAGNMAAVWGTEVVIGGGESGAHVDAHRQVEAFDTGSQTWRDWPSFQDSRHGSGFAIIGDYLYTAAGSGDRGGEPELTSLERLKLPQTDAAANIPAAKTQPVHQLWHTVTLSFEGPMTRETATPNPFTDYRLGVEFTHAETAYTVRGFYAGDGEAAQTGAESGNIWQARFTPDRVGAWTYKAKLQHADMIAIETEAFAGEPVELTHAEGSFLVEPSDKDGRDFRAHGRLVADGAYYRFSSSGAPWIKGGANSPENLLGYVDFDGTYRIKDEVRDGEATAGGELHRYAPHLGDWYIGDPSWRGGKGKSLIGALNYLSDAGMNSVYFLTMNIMGDGKDVWPFRDPEDFTRFDVSKLDQWDIVFSHMQERGILLHMVTQETENELLFDGGETGPERQLYLNELIARFAHHPALIWNLGEENGPVSWRPEGQDNQQREDMAAYLKANDPYNHPVLLHTHAEAHDKDEILTPLLGFADLDGLSFQIADRTTVNQQVRKWRDLAEVAGQPWLITMDEIGLWNIGAVPDASDPHHNDLRRHVLWGTLLGGGAGVEWYFGAHQPGNDLTSEDWRMRANLWGQTRHAMQFFENNLPYTEMRPCAEGVAAAQIYCFSKPGEVYALYVSAGAPLNINIAPEDTSYAAHWYDPVQGGDLHPTNLKTNALGNQILIGSPPAPTQDWVLLIRNLQPPD